MEYRSGRITWSFDPKVKVASAFASMWSHHLNRGVALWRDRSFLAPATAASLRSIDKPGQYAWDVHGL